MNPPIKLTEAQYRALKKKLHQAHDKIIKLTLHDVEAMRELLQKIIMPLLGNVRLDLDDLTLDNTSYIRPTSQLPTVKRQLKSEKDLKKKLENSLKKQKK